MNFDLTEDQRRILQAAREFTSRVVTARAVQVDREGHLDSALVEQLGKEGWLGMTIPKEQGGSGGDFVSLALAVEEIAVACANTAAFVTTNVLLVGRALLKFGTEEQQQELLGKVTRGAAQGALALVDPEHPPTLTAESREDGSFVLRGETGPVTLFGEPNFVLVVARFADEHHAAFVVPNAAAGLSITKLPASLGKRATGLAMLRFEDVRVGAGAILGGPNDGLSVALSALEDARIGAAAEAIGIARAAYEQAVLHLKQEPPKPVDPGLLGVQTMLADMSVDLEAARLLVLRAARLADEGEASASERSMAKLFATEMSTRVAHKAMQILGARGAATTPDIERHYRDARMTELSDESTEVQRAVIARTMLKT